MEKFLVLTNNLKAIVSPYIYQIPMWRIIDDKIDGEYVNGLHDNMTSKILKAAKNICDNNGTVPTTIDNSVRDYAVLIGREVTPEWFEGIDFDNLKLEDYQKVEKFANTYDYNKSHEDKFFREYDHSVWIYKGFIWVMAERMRHLEHDRLSGDGVELNPNQESIGIMEYEFQMKYKPMVKEYK